jgi:Peptidase family S41/N-terminal domain of Peptidase_S41 in eukaryotic IRBP
MRRLCFDAFESRAPQSSSVKTPMNKMTGVLIVAAAFLFLSTANGFSETTIPDTPAGKTLRAWLDAFNSGDRAKVEAYIKTFDPEQSVERMMGFHNQTGGFDLLAIESSEPLRIRFRVKEKASSTVGIGNIELKDAQPGVVESFSLRAIPPGAVVENVKLDASERQRVIDGLIKNLKESYVYPDLAQKMEDAIRANQNHGDYDAITDGDTFANRLTKELRAVSHDKHLGVNHSPVKLPPEGQKPSPEEEAQFRKMMERTNCSFEKVEVLSQNIGYLKFNAFLDPTICGPTVVAAMNFLAHVDAIIFDLRENGGGDPKMVAMISSYLFDKPTHLNDLYNRKEDFTTQYWTLPYVPGATLADKPAFVLTSKSTFSGAEEFTYNLKNLKRATIVGETTGGGAHPVEAHRIDDHFMIGVPFARAVNPVSKKNWEGTGVEPDVPVKAEEALEKAEELAKSKLPKQ